MPRLTRIGPIHVRTTSTNGWVSGIGASRTSIGSCAVCVVPRSRTGMSLNDWIKMFMLLKTFFLSKKEGFDFINGVGIKTRKN